MISFNTGKRIISSIEAINVNTGEIVAFISRSGQCFIVNEVVDGEHKPVYYAYCIYLAKKDIETNYLTKGNTDNDITAIDAALLSEAL